MNKQIAKINLYLTFFRLGVGLPRAVHAGYFYIDNLGIVFYITPDGVSCAGQMSYSGNIV